MAGVGHGHVTLDRTNLMRLIELVEQECVPLLPSAEARIGGQCVIEAMRSLAVEMPHLYGDEGYPITPTKENS